jgi:carboxyl-terminal processing protease
MISRGTEQAMGAGLLLILAAVQAAGGSPADELLEKGIYFEETKGDLDAAMGIYQRIVDDSRADRALAAQAQLRLGLCELKRGNKPRAIAALEQLTHEFPDKEKLVAMVGQHMPRLLDEMLQQIEQNYIREVDRTELMETAIRAIIGKLDSRAGLRSADMEFLGAKETAEINLGLEQKVAGIGAVLKLDEATREVVVRSTLPHSPARGQLEEGDRIINVDGVLLPRDGKELETALVRLRGTPDSTVRVGVRRGEAAEVVEVELRRAIVRLPSVFGDRVNSDHSPDFMLDDRRKIGYIRLTYIGKQTAQEVQAALDDLKARGVKALILDLRNGPGGWLEGAAAVADFFVEDGNIVTVRSRKEETVYDARGEGTFSGIPMAVLVNRNTASAAEIIAACLQDHRRAVVVGERTVGQGIVRTLVPLNGGAGTLKLPIAAYYRPSGKTMNRHPDSTESDDWGVTPNQGCEVVMSDDELKQLETHWAGRQVIADPQAAEAEFHDDQLEKALESLEAQLNRR